MDKMREVFALQVSRIQSIDTVCFGKKESLTATKPEVLGLSMTSGFSDITIVFKSKIKFKFQL